MQTLDYIVLAVYFFGMIAIGLICMRMVKKQEDYFMGGRSFGKILQTFAAFGAGTGANDPIQVGRTTWTSGLNGIWSVLIWLFVTPFYWITGVWYRRMRHVTLGDWFVERYNSKSLGVAYTFFAIAFYMMYLSTMFSAIGKFAASVVGQDDVMFMGQPMGLEYLLVPFIALMVVAYGVLGGLRAAYWTDLIQGLCIILLSVILLPYGLNQLANKYPDETTQEIIDQNGETSMQTSVDGFRVMHQRAPDSYFQIFGGPKSREFPVHYIIVFTLLALMGIVVQPHFIATGGGTAKSENAARLGLVTGNFLKRFCTIGWAITGLILLALMAGNPEAARDPDRVWGIATRTILGPMGIGLVGLMLACLLAALMSSADCYMLITSALVVRNIYAPYFNPNAEEKTYIRAGRIASFAVILGAAIVSLYFMDVFKQFKASLEVAAIFSAPFLVGMYWRRANKYSAWLTLLFTVTVFFVLPSLIPALKPELRDDQTYSTKNDIVVTVTERVATATDVEQRLAKIGIWEQDYREARSLETRAKIRYREVYGDEVDDMENAPNEVKSAYKNLEAARAKIRGLGPRPAKLKIGELFSNRSETGGKSVFWRGGVEAVGEVTREKMSEETSEDGNTTTTVYRETGEYRGKGGLELAFVIYKMMGIELQDKDNAMLGTLRLPPLLILPFVVMFIFSFVTPGTGRDKLDRYYVKMKTPVEPSPERDQDELEASYADPTRYDDKKMFPSSKWEFQKPSKYDVIGFIACFGVCFIFIGLAIWLANIGARP